MNHTKLCLISFICLLLVSCASKRKYAFDTSCFEYGNRAHVITYSDSLFRQRIKDAPNAKVYDNLNWTEKSESELEYPKKALRYGNSGYVIFNIYVDTTGKVSDFALVESCPDTLFVEAGIKYISKVYFTSIATNNPVKAFCGRKRLTWK